MFCVIYYLIFKKPLVLITLILEITYKILD